jgi:hypothetical protein
MWERHIDFKFFLRFPLSGFGFVGITEFYDTEIDYFTEQLVGGEIGVRASQY